MTEGSAEDRLFSSLDLSGIEDALRGSDGWGDLRFEQIVEKLISGEYDISQGLGQMVWQFFWGEWETNRKYLIYILLLTIAFSLLKNFAQVFEQSYISNVCFLLVYALLMVLLMKSDLFLAASDVIRSGIGAAALVVLVILVAVPLSKVGIMTFFYRVLAAFVEPVADKRISNAILVAAKGGGMLFKLLTNCAILIFITVAMTTLIGGR